MDLSINGRTPYVPKTSWFRTEPRRANLGKPPSEFMLIAASVPRSCQTWQERANIPDVSDCRRLIFPAVAEQGEPRARPNNPGSC
jgi:hypothetical protein